MILTRIGQVVAWLAFVFGLVSTALGFIAVFGSVPTEVITGKLIDNGIISLLFGLCLGVLTDISDTLFQSTGTQE